MLKLLSLMSLSSLVVLWWCLCVGMFFIFRLNVMLLIMCFYGNNVCCWNMSL